ncbi:hypothetical protein GGR20_003702 [Devosia subaequoris]|uniref:Uncharacterized protein n=1 Tax=Devosia subaequoris TaxID=395930 RepID=A0A7W6IQN9_9HYPH|nr:hypothetical protein [Devosia subaequoris]
MAVRDTVLAPPEMTIGVSFDADNPGVGYSMATG